ncbi:MAG: type II secretion system F family protein [Ignavibacteriales bacterium]
MKSALLLVLIAFFIVLYFLSKGKGSEYSKQMEPYGFKLPFLAPMGFYVAGILPYKFNSGYDRKVRGKVGELYGQKGVNEFFVVHNAQRVAMVLAVLFLFGFFSLLGEVDVSFPIFGLLVAGLIYYSTDQGIEKKLETRKQEILIDLPVFLSTLVLLLGAGVPFTSAIQKVVHDGDQSRPLYIELNTVLMEISAGKPANQAYEDLAQRCRVPEITRFVSMLLQNLSRGSADLVLALRNLSQECWGRRKDVARKMGEEASSKLVIPMVLIFLAVGIIVLAPAIMGLSQ